MHVSEQVKATSLKMDAEVAAALTRALSSDLNGVKMEIQSRCARRKSTSIRAMLTAC